MNILLYNLHLLLVQVFGQLLLQFNWNAHVLFLVAIFRLDGLHFGTFQHLFFTFEFFLEQVELTWHTHSIRLHGASKGLCFLVGFQHETFALDKVYIIAGHFHKVITLKLLILLRLIWIGILLHRPRLWIIWS